MMKINFAAVSQRFHGRLVLGPLDCSLRAGKITAVTGTNGSGKSTFLKLAGHFLPPTQGEITVMAGAEKLKGEMLRKHIAMVTPELRFYDRLTARENLDFLLGLRGMHLDEKFYRGLLERVGLFEQDICHSFVGDFSTGMSQRLKIAALLAVQADIWLLDEPGANLDESGRIMIARELQAARECGVLVVLATNDPGEEALADEIIALAGH
ncbi:MAG: ABC transporter ATP-binding protein [Selenomonas sp.]|uniref:ABC transporter ATP-binding protein n=1 Tax=Selenomonas sp. TaxID=2053611 RepID=UPI0025CDFDF7|nr:ABC transporter ATP-binding protein [Selenomonas sp.]MCR5756313.1 ABC transporter ATP-binding protein [Selenomonas sp.]